MKDEHTYGKKMARKGCTKVIYKGTFVSEQSLVDIVTDSINAKPYISTENVNPMNLINFFCVVTWAWKFLTYKVMEAAHFGTSHSAIHISNSRTKTKGLDF